MTDQELRKLKRDELLQIMIAQSKRIAVLKKRLDAAEKKLASRELALQETGNIAEASLKLNKIFEDAQAAADQYLYNVKRMAQKELQRQGLVRGKHAAPVEEDQDYADQIAEETAVEEEAGAEAVMEEAAEDEAASESEEFRTILQETMSGAAETEAEYAESVKGQEAGSSYDGLHGEDEDDAHAEAEEEEDGAEDDSEYEEDAEDEEEGSEDDEFEEEDVDDEEDGDAEEDAGDEDDGSADEIETVENIEAESEEISEQAGKPEGRSFFGNKDKDSYLL